MHPNQHAVIDNAHSAEEVGVDFDLGAEFLRDRPREFYAQLLGLEVDLVVQVLLGDVEVPRGGLGLIL